MENKENKITLHKIEERLVYLNSLKLWMVRSYRRWMAKYRWVDETPKDPYQTDYSSNVIFSVIQWKQAELLSWVQEYDFIWLDDDWYRNVPLIKKIWDFEWIKSNTDKVLWNVFLSWNIAWDWYAYEWMRRIERKIKTPILKNWDVIDFKEEKVVEYEWIYTEFIPWENVYHDWRTIWEANEAIWVKDWDRVEYINTFWNNPNYKNVNDELPVWKYYYSWDNWDLVIKSSINDENIVTELVYYNKSRDEMIKLVNWIEVYSSPIPYSHKEIPIIQYFDYLLLDRVLNMWEYELLEKDEYLKDALRWLFIDVTKAQVWFTVVDPTEDFDEATVEIWVDRFTRANPENIKHFAPNISSNWISAAEAKVDEDIIVKSWIDFKSQILWPWETATKTAAKTQSARKRINLNLKMNAYNFFERLARLRMANIQSYYWAETKKVPVKGMNISSDWVATPSKGYWIFTVKPSNVKWKFNVVPITDSILWVSSEKEKVRLLEFSQIASTFVWEDGKPLINMEKLVEQIATKFGLDFEQLSSSSSEAINPNKVIDDLDKLDDWIKPWSMMDENYIPPEQRSWAQNSKIGWLTNSLPIE